MFSRVFNGTAWTFSVKNYAWNFWFWAEKNHSLPLPYLKDKKLELFNELIMWTEIVMRNQLCLEKIKPLNNKSKKSMSSEISFQTLSKFYINSIKKSRFVLYLYFFLSISFFICVKIKKKRRQIIFYESSETEKQENENDQVCHW